MEDRAAQSVAEHGSRVKMRTGEGPSVEQGGTKGKWKSMWIHHRGRGQCGCITEAGWNAMQGELETEG